MKKLYSVSKNFNNLVYFKPTEFKFDFKRELFRYDYVKMLMRKFDKARMLLYLGLVIGNDTRDPLITYADENIFNILGIPYNRLNEWNSYIDKFIESNVYDSKCTIDDIEISFNDNLCYLKCDILKRKYKILKSKYNDKYKGEIFSCFLRYESLGFLTSLSAAVKPEIYDYLHDNCHCDIELFASLFNSRLKYYFGLFYDLEKHFGCLGNFFKSKLVSGFFVANPPYDLLIMNMFFDKIKKELQKNDITVYMTLPAWDNDDRKKINKYCSNDKQLKTDYDDKYDIHKLDEYVIINNLFCKSKYTFYDYLVQKYINFAPVNVLVVSSNKTKKINLDILQTTSGDIILDVEPK